MKQITNLAERDLKLLDIENQIKKRQKMILEKGRQLEHTKKENQFLEHVYKDYHKYYTYILTQKEQQIKSFNILQNYLDNLMSTEKMTTEEVENMKNEQGSILKELDKIKKEMDTLIS